MASLALGVRFNPVSAGVVDFVYASVVTGYRDPVAGLVNSKTYRYRAESADLSQWEFGTGIWSSSTNTLSRNTVDFSSTGSKVSFTTQPQVAITIAPADVLSFDDAMSLTTAQKAQAKSNIRVSTPTVQRFITGTAQTYTTPANCTWIRIRMVGGGAGGSGAGTSGVGAGGAGTASTWSGGSLSAGGASAHVQSSTPPAGGTATGGNVANINGAQGSASNNAASSDSPAGGNSYFGGAGGGSINANAPGIAAANSGSGGGAGSAVLGIANAGGSSGGAGGYVEHIIASPAASYTYTVGQNGAGGTAGVNGGAGSAGGAGIIIVEEYYD